MFSIRPCSACNIGWQTVDIEDPPPLVPIGNTEGDHPHVVLGEGFEVEPAAHTAHE